MRFILFYTGLLIILFGLALILPSNPHDGSTPHTAHSEVTPK